MACFRCAGVRFSRFAAISRAAAKAAGAKLRRIGALPVRVDWAARAAICEQCPLRVVHRGTSYCGTPYLRQTDRDPATDGCGCPTRDKARGPAEHCPLDVRHRPAGHIDGRCNCKWCGAGNGSA